MSIGEMGVCSLFGRGRDAPGVGVGGAVKVSAGLSHQSAERVALVLSPT